MTLINNPPIARAKLDAKPAPIKLGEELPVFCERCGYSLHGLEQTRCEHCTLLQFHCPECGHHQPINTLRPAAQVLLGRIRGGWLAVVILFKLVLFGSLMMAWFAMGAGWSYTYDWNAYNAQMAGQQQAAAAAAAVGKPPPAAPVYQAPSMLPLQKLTWEVWLAFGLMGMLFGMVTRMMLLRWRRGFLVGVVLAGLVLVAIWLGVTVRRTDNEIRNYDVPWPFTQAFLTMNVWGIACLIAGASVVWSIWTILVKAFLPQRAAAALLEWQRSLSQSHVVSDLARDAISTHAARALPAR